jgi:beta-lactam-binding protein with PASTA domain
MNCPQCGSQLAGDPTFCDNCGARLKGSRRSDEREMNASPRSPIEAASDTIILDTEANATSLPFGRYRALEQIGSGAMGVVYLAMDDVIHRKVAIKVLNLEGVRPDDAEEMKERFTREAQAAGMLSHPNIVTIYDVGEEKGQPYIAMEYLGGDTVAALMHGKPLPIPQVTGIIAQVLSALSYAHEHDVIHRDIKPDNIFVLPDGRVKVADFGIARLPSSSTMTLEGQVIGTPGYMSPEQVKGEPVGPESDLFSSGVLLYELVTGTAAFAAPSLTSVLYNIVHEEPTSAHLLNHSIPFSLEAVIAKATAKSRLVRYDSAAEMMADIEAGRAPVIAGQPVDQTDTVLRTLPVPVVAQQAVPVASAAADASGQPASVSRKNTRKRAILGAGALASILLALAIILLLVPLHSAVVKVPGVVGESETDAKAALEEAGFKAKVLYKADNSKPKGTVLSQSSKDGSVVRRGSTVRITVASVKQVDVPNVVGIQQDRALAMIKNASLTFSLAQQITQDQGKHGMIVSQNPGPGSKADPGTSIALVVAVHQPAAPQPNTANQPAAAQPTTANQPAAQPTTVTGPQQKAVPSVVGSTKDEAIASLSAAGFTQITVVVEDTVPSNVGKVMSQDPSPGTEALVTDIVTITVGQTPGT